jgi:threonine-phosphate decarboxylase
MIIGHGGNVYDLAQRLGCEISEIIDMSSNVNPLGPPPGVEDTLKTHLDGITRLPEVDSGELIHAFSNRYGVDPKRVLAGNGSTQFIYTIPQAIETKRVVIIGPTYSDYADACSMYEVPYEYYFVHEADNFKPDFDHLKRYLQPQDVVFICNPNNPTGVLYKISEIKYLCDTCPKTTFIIDESYLPFVCSHRPESMIEQDLSNLIILNSMSKIFRISGLRIGFVIASERTIQKFSRYMLPWSVNSLAQAAVCFLMKNRSEVDAFVEHTQRFLAKERSLMAEGLENKAYLKVFPSTTSFMLAKLSKAYTAEVICEHLAKKKILIRNCSNFKGLSNRFIRISLKNSEMNQMLIEKLTALIQS